MNQDLVSLINFIRSHNAVFCLGASHIARELLSFCWDNGVKIDAFVQPDDAPDGANFFGVPVYGYSRVPVAQNCGWIVAVGDAGAAGAFLNLQRNGIFDSFLVTESMVSEMVRLALAPNAKLKGAADSERCFILCTGPSINKQDLLKLKNETVFSCSGIFNMSQYKEIAPKYYVTPAVEDAGHGAQFVYDWHSNLNEKVESDIVILDYKDRIYTRQIDAYKNKKVFYILQNLAWDNQSTVLHDLTASTPIIWTVPIMMIKIAMYMGFKKIYIMGVELDSIVKPYDHAYDVNVWPENVRPILVKDRLHGDHGSVLQRLTYTSYTFSELRCLHNIAVANGIEIYNATAGGIVDEFPRVEYESLFGE